MASITEDGLVLSGYQKKLKTMKKKYFALYKETSHAAARLEYYDSEKKFIQRAEPKRVIYLKNCFNINRRLDTKHKFVLVLSSREGGFGIVLDSENDLRKWLDKLLSLQRDNANITDQVYSAYDHVWQVIVQKKGLSEKVGITGSYHCCLTPKSLTFVCIGPEKTINGDNRVSKVEILLTTIRRCGHASPQCIFYMELGRQSVLGSGELWMETDDAATARNMHDMILSAMSAKTESNMNLINVYQGGRSDLNHVPMRKRSSSANEASKPINVLHKRQNPVDIGSSISPHNNCYGRERCDSLPTRNRTLSECSNQTYISSTHGFRNNTITGVRPHSSNRHSNSPPLNTPMRCSESEESSISIDETDDNGSFSHYRLNTRSSKGVIPEENADDFTMADHNKIIGLNENVGNYIPMTPIKPSEMENANQIADDEHIHFDFPEHSSEKLAKDFDMDSDSQCDRPTRCYSIGSKVEHFKIRQRLGHVNEMDKNSPRVRAYSVGSRSKIPRCDLQRFVLVDKVKNEFGSKGSHSNISMDGPQSNDVIRFQSTRQQKSISAPLLSLKHQMNSERMSDLMEIDFSKIAAPSSSSISVEKPKISQVTKPIESVIPINSRNGNPNVSAPFKLSLKPDEIQRNSFNNCQSSSEGGYLEMKPVGNTLKCDSNVADLSNEVEKIMLDHSYDLHLLDKANSRLQGKIGAPLEKRPSLKSIKSSLNDTKVDASTRLPTMEENAVVVPKLDLNNPPPPPKAEEKKRCVTTNKNNNLELSGSPTTEEKKLIHSISNEDYTQNLTKSAADNEGGYKILQIKSDSSLISSKRNQRAIYKDQFERQQQRQLENVPTDQTAPNKCNLTFITTELKSSDAAAAATASAAADLLSNILQIKDLNSTSRPPSRISQELYYASLDLPQCSGNQMGPKGLKRGSCESPPVAAVSETGNSYAKIDFDQSDSSSSSSKICNV